MIEVCSSAMSPAAGLDKIPAKPLDDDNMERKEQYILQGFPEWSWCDFQQLIRGMETNGWQDTV